MMYDDLHVTNGGFPVRNPLKPLKNQRVPLYVSALEIFPTFPVRKTDPLGSTEIRKKNSHSENMET
jgi:hypothetical protein